MAQAMAGATFAQALRDEGCTVVEVPDWLTNNRDGHGPFAPQGVTIHHIGSVVANDSAAAYARNVLYAGYAGLPGPICHVGAAPDGRLFMVGNGRANHAGGGHPASAAIVAADAAPFDRELVPRFGNLTPGHADGNAIMYGIEIMYSGGTAMTPEQLDAAVRFAAAICRHHGWSAHSVIAHREWSSDKNDPGRQGMGEFRQLVQNRLSGPPSGSGSTTPPPTQESDTMIPFLITAFGPDGSTGSDDGLCVVTQEGIYSIPGPDHLYSIGRWINVLTNPSDRGLTTYEVALVQATLNPAPPSSTGQARGFAALPAPSAPVLFSTAAGERTEVRPGSDIPTEEPTEHPVVSVCDDPDAPTR